MTTQTTHRIITGDSRSMAAVEDASVELIVTSPPYPMVEMWDELFARQDAEIRAELVAGRGAAAFEKMHAVLDEVWAECDRVLAQSGFVCVNIGDATRTIGGEFRLYPNHARILNWFLNRGYCVLPDIHWRKQSNAPNKFMGSGMYPAGAYVTYEHEYILVFRKGGKRTFAGEEKLRRQKSAYFWEERNVWFSDLWDIKGTAQGIAAAGAGRERNASYPFEVPYRLVNMYSVEGDTVLDPFAGLGTTALACMAAKRSSIGCEVDAGIAALARENLLAQPQRLNRAVDARLERHEAFIAALPGDKYDKCYDNPYHGFKVKTKQETAIRLERLTGVKAGDGEIVCTYG